MSQQINLFNPVFRRQKKMFSATTMAQALALLVVGIVALAAYGKSQVAKLEQEAALGAEQLSRKQAGLASTMQEFSPRKKDPALEAELAEAEARLAGLRRVSGALESGELGNTSGYAEYFRALARQSVDGLWLTGLRIAAAGSDIGIRGRALDPALIPGYITRLTMEPVFQGKSFASLQIGQGQPLVQPGADGKETAAPAPYVEFSLQSEQVTEKP